MRKGKSPFETLERFSRRLSISLGVWIFSALGLAADEWLIVNVGVNNQTVPLLFDTGTSETLLFERTADRLGLEVEAPSPDLKSEPGKVLMGTTETSQFTIGGVTHETKLRVFDFPDYVNAPFEGILAWADVKDSIIQVNADSGSLSILPSLPHDIDQWTKWELVKDTRLLRISPPRDQRSDNYLFIDTGGSSLGIELNSLRWKDWRSKHKKEPYIFVADYTPASGIRVQEVRWAQTLVVYGGIVFKNVPVSEYKAFSNSERSNHKATLNLFALNRLELIIDGRQGHCYFRTIGNSDSKYEYSRLGAVFIPREPTSNDLIAHVVRHSPAYRAGVRNGDILLRIDNINFGNWRSDPDLSPNNYFFKLAAGTEVKLALKRKRKVFEVNVVLREVFKQ